MSGNEDELPADDGDEDSMADATPRLVEAAPPTVGTSDQPYTVAGIAIPGIYDIEQAGAGIKSQYLTEVEPGGYGSDTTPSEGTQGSEGSEGSTGEGGETADEGGGESSAPGDTAEPPMQVTLRAKVGADTWNDLEALRERTETFGVGLGDIQLDDMELVDLQRRLTGDYPFAYDVTVKVQEYREYELRTNLQPGGSSSGGSTGSGSVDGLGPGGPTLDWVGEEPADVPSDAVDITAEGADNTGSEPVNAALQGAIGDNTTVLFPPGEYLLDPISLTGSDWEIVGHDATLIADGVVGNWITASGSGWTMRNFVAENRNGASPAVRPQGSDWRILNWYASGSVGAHGQGGNGDAGAMFYPAVGSGTGVMENVLTPDGSSSAETSNRTGLWVGSGHAGHLILHRTLWSQWGQNTVYAESYGPGEFTLSNSTIQDSNVGVRVGGNTTVRNTRFISTGDFPGQRWTGGASTQRGLWIAQNSQKSGSLTVVGCDFEMTGPNASTAIVEGGGGLSGDVTVEDTRIRGTGIQLSSALQADGLHVTDAGVSAGGGSISNSCVTGSVSGVSGDFESSSCDLPTVDGPFPSSSAGDDPGPGTDPSA